MEIARLEIENFRGIREASIAFGRHSVLVGANNAGKTTVIEALALLFGRDRMVRPLTEHDFFGGCPAPADRIRIVATVVGFEGDEPADHPGWFRDDRAIVKWWDPARQTLHAARGEPDWRLACQVALCARFDQPSLEVETLRYFHDDDMMEDPFLDEVVTPIPARLVRELGFFLIPASRTWDRMISFGSELFRRVVASSAGQPADSVIGERNRLRAPAQPLEDDPQLEPIVAQLNAELGGFFRSQPRLQLRVTATYEGLRRLHPSLVPLVDGDGAGRGYADTLAGGGEPPSTILRWPDGWAIEHVVGWILDADPEGVVATLADLIDPGVADVRALITRLASKDRAAHGLKDDRIAYEAVAGAVGASPACRARARDLLNALSTAAMGGDTPRFTSELGGDARVRIFRP